MGFNLAFEELRSELFIQSALKGSIKKVKVKVKLKSNVEQATKAQRRSRGTALLFVSPRR